MTTRDRSILMVLAVLAAIAGFWFMALAPKRSEVARLESDLTVQRDRLQTAQATAAQAGQARARYAEDYATVARLGKAVPTDDEMPSLLFQLESAADGAKVDFRSITRSGGSGDAAAGGSTDGAAATSAQSSGSDEASSAQAAGTSTSATAASALPPGASVGSAGLATLPFSFTFRGSYFQLEKFLRTVDGFVTARKGAISVRGRLLTVEGVSLAPAENSFTSIEARVSATAYLQPDGSAASAGAGASGGSTAPAADATAAPTQTASATPSGAQ